MKQELRHIYDDLSNGKVSQREALERIRAVKANESGKSAGLLVATPVWAASGAAAAGAPLADGAHVVLLGELPHVDATQVRAALLGTQCLALPAAESVAMRYEEAAIACIEQIQRLLADRAAGAVCVQVVVADHADQAVLAGLSGLLRTAALEAPRLNGQVLLVPRDTTPETLAGWLRAETGTPDPLIRYADGGRQVVRWDVVAPAEP